MPPRRQAPPRREGYPEGSPGGKRNRTDACSEHLAVVIFDFAFEALLDVTLELGLAELDAAPHLIQRSTAVGVRSDAHPVSAGRTDLVPTTAPHL